MPVSQLGQQRIKVSRISYPAFEHWCSISKTHIAASGSYPPLAASAFTIHLLPLEPCFPEADRYNLKIRSVIPPK